jgi:hypothetical protein
MANDVPEKLPALSTRIVTRRRHMRFDVLGQVEAHSVWRLKPILLREISEGGFSLESTTPFEVNSVYKFRLGVEGHKKSIIVQARAAHCTLVSISADLPIYVAGFEIGETSETVMREMRALARYAEALWQEQ